MTEAPLVAIQIGADSKPSATRLYGGDSCWLRCSEEGISIDELVISKISRQPTGLCAEVM